MVRTSSFNPHDFYKNLLSTIQERDIKNVAFVMLSHIGEDNSITLKALAMRVYGEFTDSTERKTRAVLEDLVTRYRFPVGASSGKSGRWLCKDRQEIEKVVSDLESRRDATNNRIACLRSAVVPVKVPEFEKPRQNSLWQEG